jgi:peptidoglycan/LPS O-acetylase OafA/YrhL
VESHREALMTIPIRGTAALVVAAVIIVATLVWLPAYRLFFAVSIVAAILVAAGLHLWHKFRPVRDEDVENKRPLGLS